ncbi:fructose-1,6-bisphosphate aldolase [Encephalitozoon hellem ATCC 50504]|uniref:fructose-bisphosphate aldolase n=1 Tax=Encephalitozoon hellem TaxID=27973 RepID=A0A9Q9F7F6_ENCHE|nr:fructose-1,6-bisphosphate aldolase [Encephalitozoon hellem ATCC 50504]AFM97635.1 fructose-1,6-bisphosphate aldolase [Encephalitozoon hellem ATCC 50504]UTX42324.1 fructose-1,6-bisphosphate aldolase [Encephalitozoon hellem]WEL37766.1 fructose-bisphosphate aldolase [Encephalitozoon hellem]|eukprot:XP_003886616.1 fructose-1,6-bisphosphate aldolase [Encephalitozoon hellem ATCC 50504]
MDCDHLLKLGMTAKKILENGKGILAADESPGTLGKRFEKLGIENTEENRRKFREILFSTKELERHIGGVILNQETFGQTNEDGVPLTKILKKRGIEIGIKLDKGLIDYKEKEKISVGLEDLDLRCKSSAFKDATFAKWRSLFYFYDGIPSEDCINENCSVLAKYAITCQKNGLVPIVEPEIFLEGDYTIESSYRVFRQILSTLVKYLNYECVYIPGVLIKTSYVTPGMLSDEKYTPKKVATYTFRALLSTIPCGVPGVVFLSGGHSSEDAISFLNAINMERGCRTWTLSFSFARALTNGVLEIWKGEDSNIQEAQRVLLETSFKAYKAAEGNLEEQEQEP